MKFRIFHVKVLFQGLTNIVQCVYGRDKETNFF